MTTEFSYSYKDMLDRLQKEKMMEQQYEKLSLPIIKIVRKNKTTVFANFDSYPKILKRNADHIGKYIQSEMGTDYTINANGQMIIQGIYKENKIESVFKKYIREFVCCRQCKGLYTDLLKEEGITFLQCNTCFARTSLGKN